MPATDTLRDMVMERLTLVSGGKRGGRVDLLQAINGDPTVKQTIDGASTLEVVVVDQHRKLLRGRSPLDERSWAVFDGLHFELVAVSKSADLITLTFEDAIVAALRRRTGKFSIKPGKVTRRELAQRLAREAKIDVAVDPDKRGPIQRVVERSTGGERSNSWEVLGEAAEDIRWRRFSDGRRLVMGSDTWLVARDSRPTTIREYSGGVHDIDFTLDVGRRASEASVTVDVAAWDLPPGSVVIAEEMGPADGRWLVSEISRSITSPRALVTLTRAKAALKEPKRERNKTKGDDGDPDFTPGQDGTDTGGSASGARERMVQFALAQAGDPYVWGASGPGSWDCSGLVQEATRAGGNVLAKPSASQWAAVQQAGKTMSVDEALRTRGALLFIQNGEIRHVAISLGNGSTIEAKGSAYGTGVFKAYAPQYTGAGWWV
ncbi:C40 family peptidase [Nocardioides lianchengensis]|uniref:NlpC/P60 family protein n=1 Tax=Nocardioides lianchengensis TaxID=1045774 RepID=A0A1G6LT76_9ACTN|nr:NlpC/P60 family protein [Nocardioides lianchengensis]NYG12452.1 cell wall-associated NlpC family hydrolase [Nocardioides lianchengensis]SDC46409.1 NlpC/P60 family protein [Nocardioides lianchengensis]